jgi:hypothetical protein
MRTLALLTLTLATFFVPFTQAEQTKDSPSIRAVFDLRRLCGLERGGPRNECGRTVMAMYDQDNSGKLNREEAMAAFAGLGLECETSKRRIFFAARYVWTVILRGEKLSVSAGRLLQYKWEAVTGAPKFEADLNLVTQAVTELLDCYSIRLSCLLDH